MKSAMCMRMFVTPPWNVKGIAVKDKAYVFVVTYNWEDLILFRFRGSDRIQEIPVKNISLFDHYLVVSGHSFHILKADSKRNMEEYYGSELPLSDYIQEHMNNSARRIQTVMDSSR